MGSLVWCGHFGPAFPLEKLMRTLVRACGALAVLSLFWAPGLRAQGQRPTSGHKELRGLDFAPDGGWRVKARRIMAKRGAQLSQGQLSAMNTAGIAEVLDGDLRIPVVFISYSDSSVSDTTPVVGDTANFRPVFFSPTPQSDVPARPYSLKTFYEQLSNGHLQVDGQLYGWIRTPLTFAAVGQNCNAIIDPCTISQIRAGLGAMLKAGLDSLNSSHIQVDWGQFDNDGGDGVPNSGDDDGVVDFVTFIHPSLGGECGGSSNRIWAHRWYLSGAIGSMYTTKTSWVGHPGQFIRIDSYTIQGARGGNSGCSASSILPVGTLAHETGHTFGIPDLYCFTQGCASEGVGEWSLMGSGNYTMPYSPVTWDGWSKLMLGWVAVDSLSSSRSVSLSPVQTSDTVLVARMASTNEYLLLENRAYLQSDTGQFNSSAGSHQKQPGLLAWHVDTGVINTYFGANEINSHTPEGLHLMQADGLNELVAGADRGDKGDPYPGLTNNHTLTYHSNPASRKNNGTVAGFVIDSIQESSPTGPVTFRFRRSAPYRVTTNKALLHALMTVNGVTDTAYEEIFGLGDSVHLSVADTQMVSSNRTRLTFASWSDGLARTHAVASDGTPDTVTANLTAAHLLNFTINGSGSVSTSGPVTGSFITQGTADTLIATPDPGESFISWSGDTATPNATLVLPMGRPFNIVANFSGASAVTFDQARDAILGIGSLTGPQAAFLDGAGNSDAVYDLGDFLAYLKANGYVTAPSPFSPAAVMQSILPHPVVRPLAPTKEH